MCKNGFNQKSAIIGAMALAVVLVSCAKNVDSYYISANGDDNNDGLSEKKALKTLSYAIRQLPENPINRFTVIGTLDITSEILFEEAEDEDMRSVFHLFHVDPDREIIISGKPGAKGAERAVLSAAGSEKGVGIVLGGGPIRFEHIEISGGETKRGVALRRGFGLMLVVGGRVILGPGAIIRDNFGAGVEMILGTCIIDGGEVRDNTGPGIVALNQSALTMKDGTISGNNYAYGGGVLLEDSATFTMSGGTISNNQAEYGGGIFLGENNTFTLTGGSITGNSASILGGGIVADTGGIFEWAGGTISGNSAPDSPEIFQND